MKEGKGKKGAIDNLKSNKILIKLNGENYQMKKNLEEAKDELRREKTEKEVLVTQISSLRSSLLAEQTLCKRLKAEKGSTEKKIQSQEEDTKRTKEVLEESKQTEIKDLLQQMKKEKEKFINEKSNLEKELCEYIL